MKLRRSRLRRKFNSKVTFENTSQSLNRPKGTKVAVDNKSPSLNTKGTKVPLENRSRSLSSPKGSKVVFKNRNRSLSLNRSKSTKVKVSQRKGKFTSSNVTLRETALNNQILRIHVPKENLNSLKINLQRSQKASNSRSSLVLVKEPYKRSTLKSQNSENKSPRSKKNQFKVRFFPNKSKSKKMVVNNGKVIKHDADDYFLKRLRAKNSKIFYLKVAPYKCTPEGKLNYKFHHLVNDVKNMQLPTPSWKIKVIIRHNKIAAIIFTNKAELERSVSFNSDDDRYHIVIDNKPALLVGSPGKVDSCNDIEVLLSIMETIEKDSPMITFK